MTLFTPQSYNSLTALREANVMEAHSDTVIDGVEIFGYFEGNPYEVKYVYDDVSEATYAVAGDCIDEPEPVVSHTTLKKSFNIRHLDTCTSDYFGGHHLPNFCLYVDGNTTYRMIRADMLDWTNTDHLTDELFKSQADWDLFQDAVDNLFQELEHEGKLDTVFNVGLEIPVTEEEQEMYNCYAWFIVETEGDDDEV